MLDVEAHLHLQRIQKGVQAVCSLIKLAVERAGGVRAAGRICGVSPHTITNVTEGKAKLSTISMVEGRLAKAGLMTLDLCASMPRDWTEETFIPLHQAVGESPLCDRAYRDWVGRGGEWPADDASEDSAYSYSLNGRASIVVKADGQFKIRHHGRALQLSVLSNPDKLDQKDALPNNAARFTVASRTQARYGLCWRHRAPVAAHARFDVVDTHLQVLCVVLTLPWRSPSGDRLLTTVSERIGY
ncbi:MAG: hypothetical protein NXI16_13965 [Alphaproteobacteria bacterium]|nr:hypothetical protein [Alphaproteobacteria bacterium]